MDYALLVEGVVRLYENPPKPFYYLDEYSQYSQDDLRELLDRAFVYEKSYGLMMDTFSWIMLAISMGFTDNSVGIEGGFHYWTERENPGTCDFDEDLYGEGDHERMSEMLEQAFYEVRAGSTPKLEDYL